jgi:hypothetical protein
MNEPYHYNGPFQVLIERSSDPDGRRLEYLRWLVQRSRDDQQVMPDAMVRSAPTTIGSAAEDPRRQAA